MVSDAVGAWVGADATDDGLDDGRIDGSTGEFDEGSSLELTDGSSDG